MTFDSDSLIDGMPRLIQAGMGVHVSSANLANITSRLGALGIVSGAALRHVTVEDVRRGDEETIQLARTFPLPQYVEDLMAFAPGGAKHRKAVPVDQPDPERGALPKRLSTMAAYVEVMRAKRGHNGKVGINVMWKCTLTVLPTIYGAMLAGIDALLCGAGVPMELPDIVRKMRAGENMAYAPLTGTGTHTHLNIAQDDSTSLLARFPAPHLMPIMSNYAFPKRMLDVWRKEYDGARPFAFILENHKAGGHNAPPRNKSEFSTQDDIDTYFHRVLELGVPVYVAGAFANGGTREDFEYWRAQGAYGIQVGSRFAMCEDSGLRKDLRENLIDASLNKELEVRTSHVMSPTGFPIKYVPMAGTTADAQTYEARPRICNRMYLVSSHFQTQADGSEKENYVCPAMPVEQYERLGGATEDTPGRVCLCNGLLSAAGYYTDVEAPIITLGVSGEQVQHNVTARDIVEDILTPEYVAQAEAKLRLSQSSELAAA